MLSETVLEWTKQWKEEGLLEGLEKGRTEGLEKGRTEGQLEERRLLAQRLLTRGMSVAEVAELTGLSAGEVEGLRR
ncbi:MAG: hypothetical protein HY814_04005 [Candidatus Riflebacteria bacterium]|nr:hypothetical protein [Candidatus Riflebacteria bacterium]